VRSANLADFADLTIAARVGRRARASGPIDLCRPCARRREREGSSPGRCRIRARAPGREPRTRHGSRTAGRGDRASWRSPSRRTVRTRPSLPSLRGRHGGFATEDLPAREHASRITAAPMPARKIQMQPRRPRRHEEGASTLSARRVNADRFRRGPAQQAPHTAGASRRASKPIDAYCSTASSANEARNTRRRILRAFFVSSCLRGLRGLSRRLIIAMQLKAVTAHPSVPPYATASCRSMKASLSGLRIARIP
jgi:hypothetical protein